MKAGMQILLMNLPIVLLVGFLVWMGVDAMPDDRVLGWFLIGAAGATLLCCMYWIEERKQR